MDQIDQTGFVIGLKPEIRAAMENLVNAGIDWRIALLQLTLWIEPIFVDLPADEQPEQPVETDVEVVIKSIEGA